MARQLVIDLLKIDGTIYGFRTTTLVVCTNTIIAASRGVAIIMNRLCENITNFHPIHIIYSQVSVRPNSQVL